MTIRHIKGLGASQPWVPICVQKHKRLREYGPCMDILAYLRMVWRVVNSEGYLATLLG